MAGLRRGANTVAFVSGCGLIVAGFALISPVTGMFAGGLMLIALSILHERGGAE